MKKDAVKLIVWSTLLITLALIAFFTSKEDTKENKKKDTQSAKLFSIEQDIIQKLRIETDTNQITLSKKDKLWEIIKPDNFEASQSNVTKWIETFTWAKPIDSFETKNNLDQFGLLNKTPSFYAWDDKNNIYSITVGDKTPDKNNYYIKINTKEKASKVFVVPTNIIGKQGLDFSLTTFRNKNFLKVTKDNLSYIVFNKLKFISGKKSMTKLALLPANIKIPKNKGLAFHSTQKILSFNDKMSPETKKEFISLASKSDSSYINAINTLYSKSNNKIWSLDSADKDIDTTKTSNFVNKVLDIRALDFVDSNRKVSFDKDSLEFAITTKKNTKKLLITLFKDAVYAKIIGSGEVYVIGKSSFDTLNRELSYFLIKEETKKGNKEQKRQSLTSNIVCYNSAHIRGR